MAKRIFSLAKFHKQTAILHKLLPLFNGDAGRIYSLHGDIGTLEELLDVADNVPFNKIEFELDQFKGRLSNINMESYIPHEHHVFNLIGRIVNMRSQTYSKTYLARILEEIKKILEKLLNAFAKGYLTREGLFPEF